MISCDWGIPQKTFNIRWMSEAHSWYLKYRVSCRASDRPNEGEVLLEESKKVREICMVKTLGVLGDENLQGKAKFSTLHFHQIFHADEYPLIGSTSHGSFILILTAWCTKYCATYQEFNRQLVRITSNTIQSEQLQ
jgi:hypothetical protein